MSERTLSMIKPDGVARDLIGEIYRRFEAAGLHVVGARMIRLDQRKARAFYQVHRERPFFDDLVAYMTSGPIMVQVLEGENAIQRNRELMGATDPARADAGTVRADYGESVERNVVHGSDGPGTAREEIDFFFQPDELHSR
ncbi:MAG: nucleoside-diphosphate kinase [Gammaproteobacteria bacterium]|nr:nucleoside-diphosphate kinase [Gammaproteobacteria bacterium]MCY4164575.1 nucleoside-diphosphate kinase [Gammaproteobacteria bacterium]MCY4340641.1 nucleoside-diphosphate kinase [Gammaproteobacteria bacterium]